MTAFFLKHVRTKPGTSPGTISFVGDVKQEKILIHEMTYGPDAVEEKDFATIEECLASKPKGGIRWINIDGLHDPELLKRVGSEYDIHPLTLEDIVNTNQRPKAEAQSGYLYVVFKMLDLAADGVKIVAEQMSFILCDNLVLSFQERASDVFKEVRNRIRAGRPGGIRSRGADYLLYSLIDAVVDHYFIVLEKVGDQIEDAEEELTRHPSQKTLRTIYELRRETIALKKNIWPMREMLSTLLKKDNEFFDRKTDVFVTDVHDHVIELLDILEGDREMLATMLDLYQSRVGNKMNEIMKVLTIIATLFIPPTFVAGIYGMNFDNMPELHSRVGYYVVLGVMLASISGMLVYFRRKKWL